MAEELALLRLSGMGDTSWGATGEGKAGREKGRGEEEGPGKSGKYTTEVAVCVFSQM